MTFPALQILGLVWLVSELCLTRRSGPEATSKDRGSLRLILLVDVVSVGLSIMAAYHFRTCVFPSRRLFYLFGICVMMVGLGLRFYSIIYLGRFFTVNVAIAADHRVIDSGPYRFIRHPSYTGVLMGILGIGLGIGNWVSLITL